MKIELKRDMVDYWNDCFNDLHILKPDWKSIERTSDRAIVFMLLNDEEEWGKLHRNSSRSLVEHSGCADRACRCHHDWPYLSYPHEPK